MIRPPIHRAAAVGFGTSADAYERGRPGYPDETVAFVKELLGGPDAERAAVLDLAAGTGIFTGALVDAGIEPVAAEPVEGMRSILQRSLPGITVVAAVAESIPFAGCSFDAVMVAQALHWFDPSRALPEIARVLRPGGMLVIAFNVRDGTDALSAGLAEIWEEYRSDTPTHRSAAWRRPFEHQPWFSPLRLRSFSQRQHVDAQGLVDRVLSVSFVASLPGDERSRVAKRVEALARGRAEMELPYRTDVWWTARQPGSAISE
ncbi:class I SAM-dependent methyltransferase [soil metagenome]